MDRKDISLQHVELKTKDDQGIIEGWASVFGGPPDSYGDIIVRGAFADSLKQRTPKFLWQHDMTKPIGKVLSLEETDYGLYGRWQLAKTAQAQEAYELMKEGLVDGLSIGYHTEDSEVNPDGDRLLKKLNLLEISGVTIPAKDTALITGVKSDVPFHMLLKQVQDAIALAVAEAKALTERRAADGRSLNDRHIAAIEALLPEAKALVGELDVLRVVPPDAEAKAAGMELLRMRARIEQARRARRRTA